MNTTAAASTRRSTMVEAVNAASTTNSGTPTRRASARQTTGLMPATMPSAWTRSGTASAAAMFGSSTGYTFEASPTMSSAMQVSVNGMPRPSAAIAPRSRMLTRFVVAARTRCATSAAIASGTSAGVSPSVTPSKRAGAPWPTSHISPIDAGRYASGEPDRSTTARLRTTTASAMKPLGAAAVGRYRRSRCPHVSGAFSAAAGRGAGAGRRSGRRRRRRVAFGADCGLDFVLIAAIVPPK